MRIKEDFDLDLLEDKGFKKCGKGRLNGEYFPIYCLEIHKEIPGFEVSILINDAEHNDRGVRFYTFVSETYKRKDFGETYPIDDVFEIPEVLIDMIKEGLVV